jgi:hypothetical protein
MHDESWQRQDARPREAARNSSDGWARLLAGRVVELVVEVARRVGRWP